MKDSEVTDIESMIEQLWAALEDAQEILGELSAFYVEVGEDTGKNEAFKESETIEKDVQRAIEAGQNAIKVRACKVVNMNTPLSENTTDRYEQSAREDQLKESHHSHNDRNWYLKPLKAPTFNGDKRKFEDFWALFTSLVDESTEPVNLKMARLRQCLTGNALEAIRGLGVPVHEYEEAKEILKTKYGGTRRLLRAYLDQLEQAPPIRSNDIHALEKFVDLVRITVVKLQAERRDGELEDGTLHSMLVKKVAWSPAGEQSLVERTRHTKISHSFQRLVERRSPIPNRSSGNGERNWAETCPARWTTESTELPGTEQDAKFSYCCNRERAK